MSKYEPLEKHLRALDKEKIPMTFEEIETLIEDVLPNSARRHRAWWSNNPTNSVITYAWLSAGYKSAEVNLEGETVTFVRQSDRAIRDAGRNPIFGCMAGTVTIPDGVDLTAPADPDWATRIEDPNLHNA